MEGVCEIILALFLAETVTTVFAAFPTPVIGAMLLFAGLELGKSVVRLRGLDLAEAVFTGAVSLLTNLAVGFLAGLLMHYTLDVVKRRAASR